MQFRNLRGAQSASQPYDASIGLLNDANPAFHDQPVGKTHATTDRTRN
jgi:hypothetical protein